jgi:hypothetical protein
LFFAHRSLQFGHLVNNRPTSQLPWCDVAWIHQTLIPVFKVTICIIDFREIDAAGVGASTMNRNIIGKVGKCS